PPNNLPIPQGFSDLGTRFVNIDLVPHPAAPIGVPGYTITIPLADPMPPGDPLTLFRLDRVLGALVPAASVTARDVTGTVDAGGQSATFTGIASFSTVVALRPSAQKAGDLNDDGIVGCLDVSLVRASFGKRAGQTGFDARADVNRDGVVNISDLAYVLRQIPQGSQCQ
ncbi:MAG TPA: dockerin type I domain-containing protein, partial [Bryobacteraceae bacterium]|nr:dockerin type I domain-containing protein [Bryobacteraceae bacterium]